MAPLHGAFYLKCDFRAEGGLRTCKENHINESIQEIKDYSKNGLPIDHGTILIGTLHHLAQLKDYGSPYGVRKNQLRGDHSRNPSCQGNGRVTGVSLVRAQYH
ncbi:hypothetical protein TNCV_4859631 [Trichonephila clavipes]|nr:hypothetical protein TNCV_4859631 [Trichonephila clavipes]